MSNTRLHPACILALLTFVLSTPAACPQTPPTPGEIVLREALVLPSVGRGGRAVTHTDAVEAMLVAGTWTAPEAGSKVSLPDGAERAWESVQAGEDGWFRHRSLNGGYLFARVPSATERVMMLEAAGHGMVYVNGEPRAGDVYSHGYVVLPVWLRAGDNDLLFSVGRGQLRARLVPPRAPVMLDTRDATLPDLRAGEKEPQWAAVVVVNATTQARSDLALTARYETGSPVRTVLPPVPPMSVRKVGFRLPGRAVGKPGTLQAALVLERQEGRGWRALDSAALSLRARAPGETYKRTFISDIDGSMQYYAVNPAWKAESQVAGRRAQGKTTDDRRPTAAVLSLNPQPSTLNRPALFLSTHGAGVEAIGQADAYGPKSWGHLVAPTNRRPYGFDWEDWGRLDALEALADAQARLGTDPHRVYLTGHSMGGHGAWTLAAHFPGLFAAVGPSAGWISFQSYGGAPRTQDPTPVQALLARAAANSDTLALGRNLADMAVYILHGDADDNVPVTEARAMRDFLSGFHHSLSYHERPGAGHWWDASPEPGADCVDWAPMFDLFAHGRIPEDGEARDVAFTTVNPGVSACYRWAGVLQQERAMLPSTVALRCDPLRRVFSGTTANTKRLALRLDPLRAGDPLSVELDGQKLDKLPWPDNEPILYLDKVGGRWVPGRLPPSEKGPHRAGPFKDAFRHRMVFVYGTRGAPEENAAMRDKARYDAETWWYRGNGAVDVLPDTSFDAAKERDRGLILYGNADTNAAWRPLLADSPVQVFRDRVTVGGREERGNDLACLFLRPRPGSDTACVGVIAGTGAAGMRLTHRLPYFLAGVAFPDVTILGSEMLTRGVEGVRLAGFFGNDWGVASGEFAWRAP